MFGVRTLPAAAGGRTVVQHCFKSSVAVIGVWLGSTLLPAHVSMASYDHASEPAKLESLTNMAEPAAPEIVPLSLAGISGNAARMLAPDRDSHVAAASAPFEPEPATLAPIAATVAWTGPMIENSATTSMSQDTRPAHWAVLAGTTREANGAPAVTRAPEERGAQLDQRLASIEHTAPALAHPPVHEATARLELRPAEQDGLRVFGSVPVRTSSKALSRVVGNAFAQTAAGTCEEGARSKACSDGVPAAWRKIAREMQALGARTKLERANREVNQRIRYMTDLALHGVADHWSPAAETMAEGAGDCEDFAILKMWLLGQAGIRPEDMFVVVVRSPHLRTEHAVLAVRMGPETFILDNLTATVKPAGEAGYFPIFSANAHGLWLHGFAAKRDVAGVARAVR